MDSSQFFDDGWKPDSEKIQEQSAIVDERCFQVILSEESEGAISQNNQLTAEFSENLQKGEVIRKNESNPQSLRDIHLEKIDGRLFNSCDKQCKDKKPKDDHYNQNFKEQQKQQKNNKETKDQNKNNKESKDPFKHAIKEQKDNASTIKEAAQIKEEQRHWPKTYEVKTAKQQVKNAGVKRQSSSTMQIVQLQNNIKISEKNLALLYCQYQGDIQQLAHALKQTSILYICKQLLPIIRTALKALQRLIKRRKLRRIFLEWNEAELKEFIHKFFEISSSSVKKFSQSKEKRKTQKLEGYEQLIDLSQIGDGTYFKLIKAKYDENINFTNVQLLQLYRAILDLHLAVYQQLDIIQNSTIESVANFDRHLAWTREEFRTLCRLILLEKDFRKISSVMVLEFGAIGSKFSTEKLFYKVETIMRMSLSKIKQQCVTYPGLGMLRKVQTNDCFRIAYCTKPRYLEMRDMLLSYFEESVPPVHSSHVLLTSLNSFLDKERQYEQGLIIDKEEEVKVFEQCKVQNLKEKSADENGAIKKWDQNSGHRNAIFRQSELSEEGFHFKQQSGNIKHDRADSSKWSQKSSKAMENKSSKLQNSQAVSEKSRCLANSVIESLFHNSNTPGDFASSQRTVSNLRQSQSSLDLAAITEEELNLTNNNANSFADSAYANLLQRKEFEYVELHPDRSQKLTRETVTHSNQTRNWNRIDPQEVIYPPALTKGQSQQLTNNNLQGVSSQAKTTQSVIDQKEEDVVSRALRRVLMARK